MTHRNEWVLASLFGLVIKWSQPNRRVPLSELLRCLSHTWYHRKFNFLGCTSPIMQSFLPRREMRISVKQIIQCPYDHRLHGRTFSLLFCLPKWNCERCLKGLSIHTIIVLRVCAVTVIYWYGCSWNHLSVVQKSLEVWVWVYVK